MKEETQSVEPMAQRSSTAIQADIDRLQTLLDDEVRRLDGLESSEGTDYQTLLANGPSDTSVIEQISKSSAQIAVLQRGLVAAKADLELAQKGELHARRTAARNAIQSKFDRCLELTAQVDKHLDSMAVSVKALHQMQRDAAAAILAASKDLGVERSGHHLMEARSSLEGNTSLENMLVLAVYKKTGLAKPFHIPAGYMRPIEEINRVSYNSAMVELDEALGLVEGS